MERKFVQRSTKKQAAERRPQRKTHRQDRRNRDDSKRKCARGKHLKRLRVQDENRREHDESTIRAQDSLRAKS